MTYGSIPPEKSRGSVYSEKCRDSAAPGKSRGSYSPRTNNSSQMLCSNYAFGTLFEAFQSYHCQTNILDIFKSGYEVVEFRKGYNTGIFSNLVSAICSERSTNL